MSIYIVNTGPNKEVHRSAHVETACNIHLIAPSHRLNTDTDYTVLYPKEYDGCEHCYTEKHWK
ncbi:hypothetical protein [Sporosarcina sp. FSL K6-2383]|uniref:hypothetical protein n=1 Tax=Sporosarcina sp. FSL K6-2383 TaxID=2921556 RepID=UPI00315AAC40